MGWVARTVAPVEPRHVNPEFYKTTQKDDFAAPTSDAYQQNSVARTVAPVEPRHV